MRYQDKRISLVIMITLFFRRDILSDNILHNYCISLSSPCHAYQLFSSKSPLRLYFFLYVKSKGVKDRQHNVFTFYLQRAIVVVPQGNRSKFSDPKINKKKRRKTSTVITFRSYTEVHCLTFKVMQSLFREQSLSLVAP